MEKVIGNYKMPEKGLGEKVNKLVDMMEKGEVSGVKKSKSWRMPLKGKLGKTKLKQGYITIVEITENNVVNFTKEIIQGGTIKLGDTYHAVEGEDILSFKGKPLIIVPKKSKWPYNPNKVENSTVGQKHIMSRMKNEQIGDNKKMGLGGMSIGAIILIGAVAYYFLAG
jgi:hypothetical protein